MSERGAGGSRPRRRRGGARRARGEAGAAAERGLDPDAEPRPSGDSRATPRRGSRTERDSRETTSRAGDDSRHRSSRDGDDSRRPGSRAGSRAGAARGRDLGERSGRGVAEDEVGRGAAPPVEDAREDAPRRPQGSGAALENGRVVRWGGFELSPFQVEAVDAIRSGCNVLVCAPTGAGKTLVAEYAIEDAVRRGRRCIYTAPIKALSNQKYRDFRDDPAVDVGLMTGDVTINPGAQVLIMTTEILRNSILDDPERLHDVEYVVFDEVHFLDDPERGTVWEESLIFAPPTLRFICLSATISNADELGTWLEEIREHAIRVIRSSRRPVPLAHRFFTARTGSFPFEKLAAMRKREASFHASPARGGRRSGRRGGRRPSGRSGFDDAPDPRPLLDELQETDLLPALVFAFSRKDCERLARRNAGRLLLSPEEARRMEALQAELVELFQLDEHAVDGEIFAMARHGVGHHHAGMLPVDKELVERMFTSGLLKLLFTTETFALGINMPARTVVFHALRKFDGVSFDYLRTRDYMQMAGRAGRQGIDERGLVYSILSPRDLLDAPLERMVDGSPEAVQSRFRLSYSTILHLVERLGRARVHEAWEKSFDQFQSERLQRKPRERNRRLQRRVIEAHLALLDRLGYLDGDVPTGRGRMAQQINGYEIQTTELAFRGTLESLPTEALAMVFVALIHEDRRRGGPPAPPARLYPGVRRYVTDVVRRAAVAAAEEGVPTPLKMPDWSLAATLVAWMRGASFEEVEETTDATPGDVVRTLRMALQLMRQVRRAIDPAWDLSERLQECIRAIDRDEIDARRQLELG